MTTHTAPTAHPDPAATGLRSADTWPMYAAASVGVSAVLTAIGTFWSPLANYDATHTWKDLVSYLVVVAIIALAAAVVFGLVVRRATAATAPKRSLVLAILAVPSLLAFWTGIPVVLAGGAVCLAAATGATTRAKAAVTLSALVCAVAVLAALAG
jgi:hypothetical protein